MGCLTIDGMVAKVQLNYDIERTGYMYFFVPGVGTAVVSMSPIGWMRRRLRDAFDGDRRLAFSCGVVTAFELSSESNLLSKRKDKYKADVYVRLDRSTVAVSRYPQSGLRGYDPVRLMSGRFPHREPKSKEKVAYVVTPPPMPTSMLPRTETTASTATPSKPLGVSGVSFRRVRTRLCDARRALELLRREYGRPGI